MQQARKKNSSHNPASTEIHAQDPSTHSVRSGTEIEHTDFLERRADGRKQCEHQAAEHDQRRPEAAASGRCRKAAGWPAEHEDDRGGMPT